jgi:hypothetical protein
MRDLRGWMLVVAGRGKGEGRGGDYVLLLEVQRGAQEDGQAL